MVIGQIRCFSEYRLQLLIEIHSPAAACTSMGGLNTTLTSNSSLLHSTAFQGDPFFVYLHGHFKEQQLSVLQLLLIAFAVNTVDQLFTPYDHNSIQAT